MLLRNLKTGFLIEFDSHLGLLSKCGIVIRIARVVFQ